MSAPGPQTHNKVRTAHQSILKFKEEWEMKVAKQITRVKTVISRGLVTQHPVKLVGILALGALLMAGTAVQFAPKSDGGPVNRSSVEKLQESPGFTDGESVKVSRINELSGETLRIREQLRAADRQEDYQEMVRYWDRLKRDAEVDTTVKSNDADATGYDRLAYLKVVEESRAQINELVKRDKAAPIIDGEISRPANNPSTATISSNEIDENFSRIREEGRAADRQDDLGDMTRYWDQLKRDAASGSTSYYDEDENERLYDELRQSFTGIPYSSSGREDLVVDRAGWPFGSLLPDTEYYRNPDFNDRQMRPSSK